MSDKKIIQPAQAFTDTVPPSNEEIHATIVLQLAKMKITNIPSANKYLRRAEYRKGWEL